MALTDYFEGFEGASATQATHKQTRQTRKRGEQAVAVDGKARKGQLQFELNDPGGGWSEGGHSGACTIHDIEAFCHDVGVVLAQVALDNQNGEVELTGAPRLLDCISWQGRVMTGDALYCQVNLCEAVLADGGDYLLVVKGNQGQLLEELEVLFEAPQMQNAHQAKLGEFDYRAASTIDKGHGRIEQRTAIASKELAGYSRWPGLSQVVQIRADTTDLGTQRGNKESHPVCSDITTRTRSVGTTTIGVGSWALEDRKSAALCEGRDAGRG